MSLWFLQMYVLESRVERKAEMRKKIKNWRNFTCFLKSCDYQPGRFAKVFTPFGSDLVWLYVQKAKQWSKHFWTGRLIINLFPILQQRVKTAVCTCSLSIHAVLWWYKLCHIEWRHLWTTILMCCLNCVNFPFGFRSKLWQGHYNLWVYIHINHLAVKGRNAEKWTSEPVSSSLQDLTGILPRVSCASLHPSSHQLWPLPLSPQKKSIPTLLGGCHRVSPWWWFRLLCSVC